MSRPRLNRPVGALGCLLAASLVPAQAAEPTLKAVDVGNGQRMWVESRPVPAADTVWVNGQAVRVLREPGAAASAATAAPSTARSAAPARPNVPAGAQAVQMPDGSKMWVLPQR